MHSLYHSVVCKYIKNILQDTIKENLIQELIYYKQKKDLNQLVEFIF